MKKNVNLSFQQNSPKKLPDFIEKVSDFSVLRKILSRGIYRFYIKRETCRFDEIQNKIGFWKSSSPAVVVFIQKHVSPILGLTIINTMLDKGDKLSELLDSHPYGSNHAPKKENQIPLTTNWSVSLDSHCIRQWSYSKKCLRAALFQEYLLDDRVADTNIPGVVDAGRPKPQNIRSIRGVLLLVIPTFDDLLYVRSKSAVD